MEKKTYTTIDEYIALFPADVQKKLKQMREAIHATAPAATEKIAYQMPTFYLNGNLVHFAAFKNHIGFYPVPSGIEAFKKDFSKYAQGKGSVQFPLDQPLPIALVKKVVRFRAAENLKKAKKK
jgi:uncharacterized protein YdhG (YjbR/CyaY superfamily)